MSFLAEWFNRPWYLVLLPLILPALWIFSLRSLSGLGRIRKWFAIGLRTAVVTCVILALAEMQHLRKSDRVTVIYLLDQSASIPRRQRDAMVDFVKEAVSEHRDAARGDRAALIVFGREANIEIPPIEDDLPILGKLESIFDLRTDATNLAAALKLAQAVFPEDSSRRVVIVTDGNENVGDAAAIARLLAADGVGIDIIPIELGGQAEVAVERVSLPADIRRGQPFSAQVVIDNIAPETSAANQSVKGTIKLARRTGPSLETLAEQPVELRPGKNVYTFSNEIEAPDFYEYEAVFVPDDPAHDLLTENNRATAYTHVLGQGHVLLIEDWENAGQFDFLTDRLRKENLEVTVQSSNQLFSSLAELQRYDAVILANVPRSSGNETSVTNFSDEQIQMLVKNTQDMGCGLVMLGGPQSFGAGGWTNTPLEEAMPVDFQINNAKVAPVGALGMVMHASEMAQGNYWQKRIAEEALKALGPQDYCGIIHWNGQEEWLWGLPQGMIKVGENRRKMIAKLSRMTPGDMPDFDPSLKLAAAAFSKLRDAAMKHMIVISDGDPSPASNNVLQAYKDLGVKITTVAVGTHGPAGHMELQRIANFTGGNYYVARDAQALPRIFQREARRVARPLVKETVVQPIVTGQHEILRGIESLPPPINGFVLTTVKENPLVEVSMISPDPADTKNATLLASWTYGLGRTAVLTTDAGARWANAWTGWPGYDKLFSQLVRWSMRPTGDQGNFSVATQTKDGKVRVVITALDQDDELQNFLNLSSSVVGPDMKSSSFEIRQISPGRYVGEFEAPQSGSYFLTISPGADKAPIRTGVNVPYSAEYRDRETNRAFIEQLAMLEPKGGKPGRIIDADLTATSTQAVAQVDSFRRDLPVAISTRDIWPLLVLAGACVFFADVFVRRVSIGFDWLPPVWARTKQLIFRAEPTDQREERIQRLRNRKQEIGEQIDQRRAATRFEPEPDADVNLDVLSDSDAARDSRTVHRDDATRMAPAEAEQDTYTARLLKAKERARRDAENK
jgi:uncharacterized membrane protein